MIYTKSLSFDNCDDLYLCLVPERAALSNPRAKCSIKADSKHVFFDVTAKDKTAFRAITSSINKLVKIHKKTKDLIKKID